jgi:hypothetical protein
VDVFIFEIHTYTESRRTLRRRKKDNHPSSKA